MQNPAPDVELYQVLFEILNSICLSEGLLLIECSTTRRIYFNLI